MIGLPSIKSQTMKIKCLCNIIVVIAIILLCGALTPTLGRNKVHYAELTWKVLPAQKADIYFHQGEEEIAFQAATIADDFTRKLEAWLDFSFYARVPIVVYAGHPLFANTNISPYYFPEGVAGFTEIIKGRVVLPYTGSRASFNRVLAHELVHAALRQKLQNLYNRTNRRSGARPPLWLEEGLAEYLSSGLPAQDSAYVAEMVIGGGLVPAQELWRIYGTYRMYKEGQSIVQWLVTERGESFLAQLVEAGLWDDNYNKGLAKVLGYDLAELDRRWQADLRKKYMPHQAERSLAGDIARPLTKAGDFALGAAAFRRVGKDYLAYISTAQDDVRVVRQEFDESGKLVNTRTLLLAGVSSKAEDILMLGNRLAVNREGTLLAVPTSSGPNYVLLLIDPLNGQVKKRIRLRGFLSLTAPGFSPDGKSIVFAATDSRGRPDLYLAEVESGQYRRITEDVRHETYPGFLFDGRRVIYLADDGNPLNQDHQDVYILDLESGSTEKLDLSGDKNGLAVSANGRRVAIITADEQGDDLGIWEAETGAYTTYAQLAGPALAPNFAPDADAVYLPASRDGFYLLHRFEIPQDAAPSMTLMVNPAAPVHGTVGSDAAINEKSKRYQPRYSLDVLQSEIAFGPEVSASLGAIVALTDVFSDRRISFAFGSTAESSSELLSGLSAGLGYADLSHRLGWSVAGFRFVEGSNFWEDRLYDEIRTGAEVSLLYPFDTFRRLELDVLSWYDEREYLIPMGRTISEQLETMMVGSAFLSFTHDSTLWQVDGPIDGSRYRLAVGNTQDFSGGKRLYLALMPDLRTYLRLGKAESIAFRLVSHHTFGKDVRPIRYGGSLSMRGWSWYDFRGTRMAMANSELRFNLADQVIADTLIGEMGAAPLRGAVFVDAGEAWYDEFPDHFRADAGFGFRWALAGVLVLRFDWAKRAVIHYGDALSRKGAQWFDFKPAFPFSFFIGWSY